MDNSLAALAGGVVGALVVGASVLAWRVSERSRQDMPPTPTPLLPSGVAALLSVLRSSAVVVGHGDQVLKASAPALSLGVVQHDRLVVPEIVEMVALVRRDGEIRETDLRLDRPLSAGPRHLTVRIAPLSSQLILVLLDDRTAEHRVDEIRRDFVANVSHELKTPVGAIALLAEALAEAGDDPDAVARFAARIGVESQRLGRLVHQIIELSRLQADEPITPGTTVEMVEAVDQARDRSRVDAEAKQVRVVADVPPGLQVSGSHEQLAVAIGNMVENAIAYSREGSSVVVSARSAGSWVEISVSDHGIGIPAEEIDRIFERFYRLDPARSRSTGGTGLGLSIVKHVAASHGGEVRVWSIEGQGSSFTLRLPAAVADRAQVGATSEQAS